MSAPIRVAGLALALACVPTLGCDTHSCTADYRSSWVLTVLDATTQEPIPGADVQYRLDGDAPQPAEMGSVGRFFGPGEQDGFYEVTVEVEGYMTAMVDIDVDADECHVITEDVTIELTPAP